MSAKLLALLFPVVLLQVTLQVLALKDLARRPRVTGVNKVTSLVYPLHHNGFRFPFLIRGEEGKQW